MRFSCQKIYKLQRLNLFSIRSRSSSLIHSKEQKPRAFCALRKIGSRLRTQSKWWKRVKFHVRDKTICQTVQFDFKATKAAAANMTFATKAHTILWLYGICYCCYCCCCWCRFCVCCVFFCSVKGKHQQHTAQHTAQYITIHASFVLLWVAFCCVLDSFHTVINDIT